MGYIRFRLGKVTDSQGRTVNAWVKRMESDMPQRISPEYVFHELARDDSMNVVMWMELDKGVLDRDIMARAEAMRLDYGCLDIDKME